MREDKSLLPWDSYLGQTLNFWTVKDLINRPGRGDYFVCSCKCGQTQFIPCNSLINQKTKSCKSCAMKFVEEVKRLKSANPASPCRRGGYKYKTLKDAVLNATFQVYQHRSKKKHHDFKINFEEFSNLVLSNCFYCAAPPSCRKTLGAFEGEFFLNSIDRVDSSKGYFLENCVACCKECNSMKLDLTLQQFYSKIAKIYEFRVKSR